MSRVVRAAGGVVTRDRSSLEVLIVHRPHYDDWSFPKGKAKSDESDMSCALREVEEETGLVCSLGEELPATEYTDSRGRPKRVRYWRMAPVGGELSFDDEVDDARWLSLEAARSVLTYGRDVELLSALGRSAAAPS